MARLQAVVSFHGQMVGPVGCIYFPLPQYVLPDPNAYVFHCPLVATNASCSLTALVMWNVKLFLSIWFKLLRPAASPDPTCLWRKKGWHSAFVSTIGPAVNCILLNAFAIE